MQPGGGGVGRGTFSCQIWVMSIFLILWDVTFLQSLLPFVVRKKKTFKYSFHEKEKVAEVALKYRDEYEEELLRLQAKGKRFTQYRRWLRRRRRRRRNKVIIIAHLYTELSTLSWYLITLMSYCDVTLKPNIWKKQQFEIVNVILRINWDFNKNFIGHSI